MAAEAISTVDPGAEDEYAVAAATAEADIYSAAEAISVAEAEI